MLNNFIKLLRKISSWEEKHGQTSKLSEKKSFFRHISYSWKQSRWFDVIVKSWHFEKQY